MDIAAEDVVRRYLAELMRSRFPTKTALAVGMGTSRSQLQASIRFGHLTVDQVNALAESTGSTVYGILRELSGLAEQMEKGKLRKLTQDEVTTMLTGAARGREDEELILEADADRRVSGGRRARRGVAQPSDEPETPGPARPTQPPAERHQKRQR